MNLLRTGFQNVSATACLCFVLTHVLRANELSVQNDRLNFYSTVVASQAGFTLVYDGGRNGVFPGEAIFIEGRSPDWLGSLNVLYTLAGDDVRIGWQFFSSGGNPTFPLSIQRATLSIGDIDWRDSAGNIVERGAVAVQILSGNWSVSSLADTGVGFQYTGPGTISSLGDLAFSARLYNSVTIPEPSTTTLIILGIGVPLLHVIKKRLRAQP